MLLYTTNITARLQYITSFIGNQLFGKAFTITNNADEFIAATEPKICYHSTNICQSAFHIVPVNLLFEIAINQQNISCFDANNRKAFFKTNGHFAFDIFAASFYLLSRYEEYLPHELDEYGRYAHTNSIAFKENFLDEPLINFWLMDLKNVLQQKFSTLTFRYSYFKFIPTYDIDIAWSYKHKGFKRTVGGITKNILQQKWHEVQLRINVLQNKAQDPFDAYEWLDALHLYCKLRPYYFFLLAERQIGFDKNINPAKKALQQLITYQSKKGTVGIHPSWQSGDKPKLLKTEIGWVEFCIDKPVKYSRQHYIRFTLPNTFRQLIDAGIEKDFSMGYGSINGFRASVSSAFYWFDLEKNEQTSLLLYPFCFMDANAFYEQKLTPKEAFEQLMHYYHQLKSVQAMMCTIWHNQFFGTDPMFKGWKEVYDIFVKEVVYWDMLQ